MKICRHHLVDAREVGKIGEEDRDAHRMVETTAGRGCDRLEIVEHAHNLRIDAIDHLHAVRIESDLA